jgi:hypothetical protein
MPYKHLSARTRLELITETVAYCRKVVAMGMPASCYSKALREPIHFLWDRIGTKYQSAKYASEEALALEKGKGLVVFDHAIPFRYQLKELISIPEINTFAVKSALEKYGVAVLITKEQDRLLTSLGLQRSMPKDWDGIDPLARYKMAKIDLIINPQWLGGLDEILYR